MKVTQKENTLKKEKKLQRKFSRKVYAPKNTSHHQMKMKSMTVRQKEFYPWLQKTLINKMPKKYMKRKKLTTKNNC